MFRTPYVPFEKVKMKEYTHRRKNKQVWRTGGIFVQYVGVPILKINLDVISEILYCKYFLNYCM